MAGGPGGKMVYLHLHSAENDYYNCYDVLQTKSNIRGVLGTIFNFVMCCTQNHTFTMSCRQISLLLVLVVRAAQVQAAVPSRGRPPAADCCGRVGADSRGGDEGRCVPPAEQNIAKRMMHPPSPAGGRFCSHRPGSWSPT